MNSPVTRYISSVAAAFVGPVMTLLDRLFTTPHPGATDVQTGAQENGYSISACLLLVVMLEAFIVRAKMITQSAARQERQALDFFRAAYTPSPLLVDVEELFVLRDVIAHNHVWHIQFETTRGRWMKVLSRVVDPGSGDKKWRAAVDVASGVTRKLKLKVQPTMIDRYDVAVVLDTVLAALVFIDEKEGGRLGIVGLRGDFLGQQDVDLWEVQSQMRARLTSR